LDGLRTCIRDIGSDVEQIWSEFLAPLVQFAHSIVVVDRFAATSHFNRRDGRSGLSRFLRGVSAVGHRYVRVFSALQSGEDPGQYATAIETMLATDGYGGFDMELFMLPDEQFRRIFHFRFLRFDALFQLRTDAGLEVLEGGTLNRPANIQFQHIEPDLPKLEQRMLSACGNTPIVKRIVPRRSGRRCDGS
jgi:hypothetical protein